MGLLSHKVKRSDLEEGDHVYVYRGVVSIYSHHGIYVGGGMVVHLSVDNFSSSSNFSASCCSSSSSSCAANDEARPSAHVCGFTKAGTGVQMTCLDCFMKEGSLRRYKYGVSKGTFLAKVRPGTCTMAKSDAAKDVIHRATYLLHNGFGNYHLLRNNCEVFALYCKTELIICYPRRASTLRSCGQATSAFTVPSAAILPAIGAMAAVEAVPVAVGVALVMHTWLRYANDIGVRTVREEDWRGGVHKVRVEDLEEFRRKYYSR